MTANHTGYAETPNVAHPLDRLAIGGHGGGFVARPPIRVWPDGIGAVDPSAIGSAGAANGTTDGARVPAVDRVCRQPAVRVTLLALPETSMS